MSKKVKIKYALLVTEEDVNENVVIFEDLRIVSANMQISGKNIGEEKNVLFCILDREFDYFTPNELTPRENPTRSYSPKPRQATLKEINLIKEYEKIEDDIIDTRNFICYDLTEDHVLVFTQYVSVNFYDNQKQDVESFQERYSIKHNIVFPYDNEDVIDDLDEDISEIKDILK